MVSEDQEILIVDQFTGRTMEGRRYSDGLHQAIEAAKVFQFKKKPKHLHRLLTKTPSMYKKLSGMTGTGKTEEEEFREIYNIWQVIPLQPTVRLPVLTISDLLYPSLKSKFKAVVEDVSLVMKKGTSPCRGTCCWKPV